MFKLTAISRSQQETITKLEHQVASEKGIHQGYLGRSRKRQRIATNAAANLHSKNARTKSQVVDANEAACLAVGRHKRAVANAATSEEKSDVNLRELEATNATEIV